MMYVHGLGEDLQKTGDSGYKIDFEHYFLDFRSRKHTLRHIMTDE